MDYSKTVLFSDLDGTMFDDETRVPERNREAIHRFCEAGGIFCVSSGRIRSNILPYLEGVVVNGPCILYNGSALLDWKSGKFLWRQTLHMDRAEAFVRYVLRTYPQIDVQVYPGDEICFLSPEKTANRDFVEQHQPCVFSSPDTVTRPWMKILMQGEPETLKRIRAEGERTAGIDDFVSTRFDYLEILPHGVSKGTTLRRAMKLPQLAGRVSVAIGDYNNDLELLKNADIGVAPDNALEEVKLLADYIVCNNNRGAVADCIEHVIPAL